MDPYVCAQISGIATGQTLQLAGEERMEKDCLNVQRLFERPLFENIPPQRRDVVASGDGNYLNIRILSTNHTIGWDKSKIITTN